MGGGVGGILLGVAQTDKTLPQRTQGDTEEDTEEHRVIPFSASLGGSLCGGGFQAAVDCDSAGDEGECDDDGEEHPSPILGGVAEGADEAAAVEVGDDGDGGVAGSAGEGNEYQEFSHGVIGRAGGSEEHAGGRGDGNRSGGDQGSGSPLLEQLQKFCQLAFLELTFQVGVSGSACEAEGEVCANDRSGGGGGGVFVPRIAMTGGEDGGENVGTAEGGERRAVENGEEEESESAEVAEGRGEGSRDSSARGWSEQGEHIGNISYVVDLRFLEGPLCFPTAKAKDLNREGR